MVLHQVKPLLPSLDDTIIPYTAIKSILFVKFFDIFGIVYFYNHVIIFRYNKNIKRVLTY